MANQQYGYSVICILFGHRLVLVKRKKLRDSAVRWQIEHNQSITLLPEVILCLYSGFSCSLWCQEWRPNRFEWSQYPHFQTWAGTLRGEADRAHNSWNPCPVSVQLLCRLPGNQPVRGQQILFGPRTWKADFSLSRVFIVLSTPGALNLPELGE